MTMPHLGNCPHKPGTWCLPCVREEWERREAEADALRAQLSAAEARIGRLRRLALAHDSPASPPEPSGDKALRLVARLAEAVAGMLDESYKDGNPVNDWTIPLRIIASQALGSSDA